MRPRAFHDKSVILLNPPVTWLFAGRGKRYAVVAGPDDSPPLHSMAQGPYEPAIMELPNVCLTLTLTLTLALTLPLTLTLTLTLSVQSREPVSLF